MVTGMDVGERVLVGIPDDESKWEGDEELDVLHPTKNNKIVLKIGIIRRFPFVNMFPPRKFSSCFQNNDRD